MTEKQSSDIAKKWMAVADTDGNGTIDIDEFTGFISKIEINDKIIIEDDAKKIFESIDEDDDGKLSEAEFGKAIHDAFFCYA